MNKTKKPQRTCMACNMQKDKDELLRIVKTQEGVIEVDPTGKKNGRGAYICKNEDCLNKIIKTNRLARIFNTTIEPEVYENIRGEIIGK